LLKSAPIAWRFTACQPALDLPMQQGRILQVKCPVRRACWSAPSRSMDLAMSQVGLEQQITTALESAIRLDRLDIAEHLIDALGTLRPEVSFGSPLASAYLSIADTAYRYRMALTRRKPAVRLNPT
jgi:hypothetical protein